MNTWQRYGRDAEYLVANYLLSKGFNVRVSKGSKGVDIFAWKDRIRLCIEVKSSVKLASIKAKDIIRLKRIAKANDCIALVAIVNEGLKIYSIDDWEEFKF